MYTGTRLIDLLEQQHQQRSQSDLFKKGTFTLSWRAKVGSFPHPDLETIVSAGEPCGTWKPTASRPEDKRNVSENWQQLRKLPLYGYLPGSAIRGLVRAWAKKRPDIQRRMVELLGEQQDNSISAGKIEFLDAWPLEPTKLTLDIVNPQQEFQVFHEGQGTPLSFYTLGDGEEEIELVVAIRGKKNRHVTADEVAEVWGWVEQALTLYGVGSRTASGYGAMSSDNVRSPQPDPGCSRKTLSFTLYSQGCYGVNRERGHEQLRPSHWRGWLRSWMLRFFLGVMSRTNAEITIGELMGTLESPDNHQSRQGSVRLQLLEQNPWGDRSQNQPNFYTWKGQLHLEAPTDLLNEIILPIVKFAASAGGVGLGWRRPLHIFTMNNGRVAARGCHLLLTHLVRNSETGKTSPKLFALGPKPELWRSTYDRWAAAAENRWKSRFLRGANQDLPGEVFAPHTCAVYLLPGPDTDPIDSRNLKWSETRPEETRGDGMHLIYQSNSQQRYKRNPEMGGDAGGGRAHCSWASIKRVNVPNQQEETDCEEIVCLFMGGQQVQGTKVRSQFLHDLKKCQGSLHLFGVTSPQA